MRRWWGFCLASAVIAVLLVMHFPQRFMDEPLFNEKRVLAARPAWPATAGDWAGIPRAVDAFVQDHFPARTRLIAALNWLRWRAGDSGSKSVVVGRHGWLFFDNGSHLGAARGVPPLKEADVNAWVTTLADRTARLAAAGIPYYVLVPPVKERVYPEHAPGWLVDGGPETDTIRLVRRARASGLDNVLYLLDDMLRMKHEQPPVYTPFDTHWTGNGAHAGYLVLAERLRGTGAAIEAWPLDRYRRVASKLVPYDLALMLGIASFVAPDFPRYEHPETVRRLATRQLTERKDWTGARVTDTGLADRPVLLFTGDSFSGELLPFLYPHFSRVVFSHHHDGWHRQDLIDEFQPNVVVLQVTEPGMRHAMAR